MPKKSIDPAKPALVVIAIGSTFMGAVDDQDEIQRVLDEVKPIAVYKHLDGALFGGYPAWHMAYSNTVFFKRPAEWIIKKYCLAGGDLPEYGGKLNHIVVMQHVKKTIIDEFIEDLLTT